MKTLLGAMMAVLVMGCLSAQSVIVTVFGTSNDTLNGYTAGQPVTFHFVINEGFGDSVATAVFGGTKWYEEKFSPNLFAGVGGTGISGFFMKPGNLHSQDYQSEIATGSNGSSFNIRLWYGTSGGMPQTGITANGGTIRELDFSLLLENEGAGNFPTEGYVFQPNDATYPLLAESLSSFGGTYTVTGSTGRMQTPDGRGTFTITSMTIMTTSAIPEPSAFAAFAGLLALGFAGCRRRPRR